MGQTLSTSVRVSSQAQPEILELRAIERSALAGKRVKFEYEFQSTVPISSLAMDFDGDGTDDLTSNDPASPLSFQYMIGGLYLARLMLVDANGETYQAEVSVDVQDLSAVDPIFQSLWDSIRQALTEGNVASALQFVTPGARPKFEAVWTALLPNIGSIYASYSPLRGYNITEDLATYFITRVVNGTTEVYFVDFIRDADGIWRVADM